MRVVAADVGGTKTLVALYEGEPGAFVEVANGRYESARFSGVAPILSAFLGDAVRTVDAAALGVAGPVVDDACQATNLPWHIDARAIERDLSIARVKLLNDFEALALGVAELPESAFVTLQDRPANPGAPAAIIGAGTGLGEAILLPAESGALPRVIATEGGHTDFAPRDDDEIALLRFLLARHARVSYERVLSGPGLAALYDFVVDAELAETSPAFAERYASTTLDGAALIGEAALSGSDAACVRAAHMFMSIYGAEAGNLALKTLPRGGLFVAGGIAPKLIELLKESAFLRSFRTKGRMETVLDTVPVRVVMDTSVGVLGPRRVAASLVAS